jgi:hypothetical protein
MVCTKDIDILNKHAQVIIKIVPEIYHLGRKFLHCLFLILRSPGWLNELGSWITLQLIQAYHQYGVGSRPAL